MAGSARPPGTRASQYFEEAAKASIYGGWWTAEGPTFSTETPIRAYRSRLRNVGGGAAPTTAPTGDFDAIRRAAIAIARVLFTNGVVGQRADRLLLVRNDADRDLVAWNETAVADRVERGIRELLEAALSRIDEAASGAKREAEEHPDWYRAAYCEGSAHGLAEAARMLRESVP